MSALGAFGGSGLVAGAGQTGLGFEIPQGNAGEIEAAARACADQASALSTFGGDVLDGARIASAAWHGPAASAFGDYTGHVVSVFAANAEAFLAGRPGAGGVLGGAV